MAIRGSREGVRKCNRVNKKTEALIDISKLKSSYLFGIEIEDNDGNPLSDAAYQDFIDRAVSMVEHELDISIVPTFDEIEYKDYHYTDYFQWGELLLNNFPVIALDSLELVYFKDQNQNDITTQRIPDSWVRLQAHDGLIRLIPNAQFSSQLQVGATGGFFPEILRSDMVPHAWKITYSHGFEDGKIPVAINHAIGMLAAVQAFSIGGGLVIGAGIASSSLSIDGLSQSIDTTQSAENHAYSAQMNNYNDLLFGKNEKDPGLIGKLRNYYKGEGFGII
jgi:hypothetical protein